MSKFTPGPWTINNNIGDLGASYAAIYDSCDRWIASAQGSNSVCGFPTDKEGMNNAHLIAAAPDMFEALDLALNTEAPWYKEVEPAIKKALAKARGES